MGRRADLRHSLTQLETSLNDSFASTSLGSHFKLGPRNSTFTRELRAGLATFLTMAYILSVNASIIADSGGACPPPASDTCLARTRADLVTATAAACVVACAAMGALANLPFALAPGMGVNTYFAYNLVGFHGSGRVPYRTALAVVLVEGCVFFTLSALGIRARLARLIPRGIRLASAAGIGLFLAFVGLQAHVGVGLVGPDPATLVTLSACARTDPETGACEGGRLRSPTFWLGALGFTITAYCAKRGVKGSFIYGILFVTLVSWVRGTRVTYFPNTPIGDTNYSYFKRIIHFHPIKSTMGALSFNGFNRSEVWVALATLLYVDVLDTTGTMYSMAEIAGFVDERGGFEGDYVAFLVDSASSILGSALGMSTMATYVESSAGIKEGGRTGLTALTVGLCFFGSMFFAPLLTSVPPWAVGPSMVMIGAMMTRTALDVKWGDAGEGVPAFVTMALMPLTYSIAYGIIGGLMVYVALRVPDWVVEAVRWVVKARRSVGGARNQVAEAGGSGGGGDGRPPEGV